MSPAQGKSWDTGGGKVYVSAADTKGSDWSTWERVMSFQPRVEHRASFWSWLNLLSWGDQRTETWLQNRVWLGLKQGMYYFPFCWVLCQACWKLLEKEGWEGGVLCCSPSHFTHQCLGVWGAFLPPASSPSQVAPSQVLCNIHVCAFLPPALPVSFLLVPGKSSAASFSSPPLPPHLPKDLSHPAALSVPHGPLEKPGPLYSLPPRHLVTSPEFPMPWTCCHSAAMLALSRSVPLYGPFPSRLAKSTSFLKSQRFGISLLWLLWASPGSVEHLLLWASMCCVQFYKHWPVVL